MTEKSKRNRWAGTALLIIAGIHTFFGAAAGARIISDPQLESLVGDRAILFDLRLFMGSEADLPMLTMFWFLFFGFALLPLGALIRHLEHESEVPRFVGMHLALLGVSGGLFLPASGFWLALVPAYNIMVGRPRESAT